MSRYLFCALFLLLACSTSFASAHKADNEESDLNVVQNVEIFKDTCKIKLNHEGGDAASKNNKIKNVDTVFFVTVGGLLVAVAEAKYTQMGNQGDTKVDFVAAYPKTTDDWDKEIFKEKNADICEKWNTQLATTNTNAKSFSTLKNVVYDAKNKSIYLLVVKQASANNEWEYNLFVGDTSKSEDGKSIMWDETKTLKITKKEHFKSKFTENVFGTSSIDNSAFVINDTKIVFVFRATNQKDKNVIALVELKINDADNSELNFLDVNETSKDCYPYFFSWGEKIVMIPTNCESSDDAYQSVKESSDMKVWKDSPGLFINLFDFLKDKTSFTAAVINGTNVLLFAKQNKTQCLKTGEDCFTFWFSDGSRVYNVGEVALYNDKEVVSSSLIYVKKTLYLLLHQQSEVSDDKKFTLTPLDKQLENITATLEKWKSANQSVLNLCGTDTSDFKTICAAPLPTHGLVGFLSGTNNNSEWMDEYLYVNAEIKGGATFQNGLICNGAGQGAKWPVDQGNENQAYKFTKYGFTLLATINIKENSGTLDNSLLGFVLNNNNERFGLWCNREKKWAISNKNKEVKNSTLECQQEKTYIVAILLNETKLSVYVNWEKVIGFKNEIEIIEKTENIKYFYFGAGLDEGDSQSTKGHVIIRNVLLYNRPFTIKELNELKPKQNTVVSDQIDKNDNTNRQTPKETTDKTGTHSDTSVTQTTTKDKKDAQSSPPPPPTAEDSALRVGVNVFFFLLAVFTLLGRYVY